MEKISGIIPANSRTRQTDSGGSQSVRPGAPTLRRPTEDKVSLGKGRGSALTTYKPSPESARVKIADDLATRFFGRNPKEVARDSDLTSSEQFTESLSEA